MHIVKVLNCCNQWFFFWSHNVHWPLFQLEHWKFHMFWPKKGPKLALSWLRPYVTTYLMKQCWNKVGMAMTTSMLTSLAHLPDPECPHYGTKGPKLAENSLIAIQIGPEGLVWVGRVETKFVPNRVHAGRPSLAFSKWKWWLNWPRRTRSGKTRLK